MTAIYGIDYPHIERAQDGALFAACGDWFSCSTGAGRHRMARTPTPPPSIIFSWTNAVQR